MLLLYRAELLSLHCRNKTKKTSSFSGSLDEESRSMVGSSVNCDYDHENVEEKNGSYQYGFYTLGDWGFGGVRATCVTRLEISICASIGTASIVPSFDSICTEKTICY